MQPKCLHETRAWAEQRLAGESEPPWAWYQLMKLIEALDAIEKAVASTSTMESLPQPGLHSGERLRLVDSTYQPDNAQHHRVDLQPQMPM